MRMLRTLEGQNSLRVIMGRAHTTDAYTRVIPNNNEIAGTGFLSITICERCNFNAPSRSAARFGAAVPRLVQHPDHISAVVGASKQH